MFHTRQACSYCFDQNQFPQRGLFSSRVFIPKQFGLATRCLWCFPSCNRALYNSKHPNREMIYLESITWRAPGKTSQMHAYHPCIQRDYRQFLKAFERSRANHARQGVFVPAYEEDRPDGTLRSGRPFYHWQKKFPSTSRVIA